MFRFVNILTLLAALALGSLSATAPAGAQVSDQCNYYPQSPGCPQYRPGQGYERNPRIGPTYPWEGRRNYQPQYQQPYVQQPRSRRRDLQYYCSLGSQTPRSMRDACRRYGYW